jgi:hypothetical protein
VALFYGVASVNGYFDEITHETLFLFMAYLADGHFDGTMRADGHFDGTMRRELSDSRPRHHPVGSAAECGGLEDFPSARNFGNAIRLGPGPRGKAGDKLQDQAASGAAWHGSQSKCHLHFFKELFPLRLRKTNDQPGETR